MLAEDASRTKRLGSDKSHRGRGWLVSVPSDHQRVVQDLIHVSGLRLRCRLNPSESVQEAFERVLNHHPDVAQVRSNRLTFSCVIHLKPEVLNNSDGFDAVQWLGTLPLTVDQLTTSAAPLSTQVRAHPGQTKSDANSPEGEADEPFVPSRVVLPLSSLALALLAGPLSLPPLAVAVFILVAARLSFKRAWEGLRDERKINVDFLDGLAVALHSLEGFLVGPSMMISMIEGGEAVRDATQRIAHSANTDLLASLQANVRRIRSDGSEELIASSELEIGDQVIFFPGDNIPVDGVIASGEGSFDVVKLTGESVPRHVGAGDEVLAGFILLEGSLVVETTAVGEATRIGQITAMIESSPVYDTRVGNYAARIANRFVMPTLVLAGVSLLLSAGNIAQAASLLMFDLGSGLRVSVPTAIMAALTRAGSQGLLIRSGRALEQLVDIDVVVFDKTGTLTQGHPSVIDVHLLRNDLTLERATWLAATAEQGLNHPIATAILHYAESLGKTPGSCESWDYRIGKGVCAVIDGHQVLIGNAKVLVEEGVTVPDLSVDEHLQASTPVYLALDGEVAAIFYAADELRSDSRQLIAELHRRGIEAHMLTGDVANVAHAVAARLGLRPEEVHAEALPDQKAELVKQLSEQGHKVAFVGDGINDSAALAYADVSISFASGSDLARETADIVLTNDKVSGLIVAQDLAKRTFALVRQNIGIVGVPNLSALAIGTFVPVSPIAAVLLNNGSCLVAAGNALRTLNFRAKELPLVESSEATAATASTVTEAASGAAPNPSRAVGVEHPQTEALSANALGQRLGISHQSITARRRRGDFSSWSQNLDPSGQGWFYCNDSRLYRPVVA